MLSFYNLPFSALHSLKPTNSLHHFFNKNTVLRLFYCVASKGEFLTFLDPFLDPPWIPLLSHVLWDLGRSGFISSLDRTSFS